MKSLLVIFTAIAMMVWSTNSFCQKKGFIPKRIVFQVKTSSDSNGVNTINQFIDTLVNSLDTENEKDSLKGMTQDVFKEMMGQFMTQEMSSEKEIIIETSKDTIWRSTIEKGKMVGDYERINPNGNIHWHAKINRQLEYQTYNVFKEVSDGKVTINKKDVRQILGYKCFSVRIVIPEKPDDEFGSFAGDKVLEMYVTNLIKLPLHSIVYVNKPYPFFPLEVKIYNEKLAGLSENYKAISIEK